MQNRTSITALVLVALTGPSMLAGVVPGRWEKVDALRKGTLITVLLESGDRLEGEFRGSDSAALFLDVDGKQIPIPRSGVQKVVRSTPEKDSPWNGAAIGSAVGLGAGIATGLAWAAAQSEEGEQGVGILVFAPIGAGIGLLTGYMIDENRTRQEVLYSAR